MDSKPMTMDKRKAVESMKKAGELAAKATTGDDESTAWNQKKYALDLCSNSLVPYDEMLRAYMDGYKPIRDSKHKQGNKR